MSVGFSPGSIAIISCANTAGWSLTAQGRGFKSCSLVVWKVFGVRRANCSSILVLIRVFETLSISIFVFQSGHDLMSWRDKVRWDGGWTLHSSPGWGSSILRVVAEWRLVRGGRWSMLDYTFIMNQSIKRRLKRRLIYWYRWDERLKTKSEESTHIRCLLQIEKRLRLFFFPLFWQRKKNSCLTAAQSGKEDHVRAMVLQRYRAKQV